MGQEVDRNQHVEQNAGAADQSKAGKAIAGGEGERSESKGGGQAAKPERPADALAHSGEVPLVTTQGKDHVDGVINAGSQQDRQCREIEIVPGPSKKPSHRHQGES